MADGQQSQGGQQFNTNDYYLKEQAARMLSAIQKGYNDNFTLASSTGSGGQQQQQQQPQQQQQVVYLNHQSQQQQSQVQQAHQQQQQPATTAHQIQVQHQQLQQQLQQVQQAQQQFQQMQQLAQMQQQFQQQYSGAAVAGGAGNLVMSPGFSPSRRGRKPTDKKKRKRHTWVKRPTTAYLYFVSKYRETLKEAGEVVPKAKIITQACAEKWRNMSEDEKEPFLELSRRDRERWQRDKAMEKKPRDPNRPKRPPSAYFLFLADFRKNYPGKADPAKEITKKAGEAWNNLSDQEKTPYYRNAQVVRAKWERDLEAYKQTSSLQLDPAKNGPLSRTTSLESDPSQVDLDGDSSPLASPQPGTSIGQINPSILQGSSMLQGGRMTGDNDPNSPSASALSQQSPSMASSTTSYDYSSHHLVAQPTGLQFPRR